MPIAKKKPPIKETVGSQYVCFNTMSEDGEWTKNYETEVEQTDVVKSVKVTENSNSAPIYSSGILYDTVNETPSVNVEVEVIAFPDETLHKMRGDLVDNGGLILSGGSGKDRTRPYFAYGKVVKMKGGKFRYDWFPKCKLSENTDETKTKEENFSEQTDTITIVAYPFNDAGDIVAKVSSDVNFPEGLTEEKFFAKPILDVAGLTAAVSGSAGA